MANYKGHLVGGVVAWSITFYLVISCSAPTAITGLQWFLLTLAGSLFPDIDTKSKGQYYFYWFMLGALVFLVVNNRLAAASFLGIFSCAPLLVRHRGIFHRFWFIVTLVVAVTIFIHVYTSILLSALMFNALFFLVGVFSHLVLDVGFARALRW